MMLTLKNLLVAGFVSAMSLTGISFANAAIIFDPGLPGTTIPNVLFSVTPGDLPQECIDSGENCSFHVVFDAMKHLQFVQPTFVAIAFAIPPNASINTSFYFTDEMHNEIPGTRRDNVTFLIWLIVR